MVCLLLFLFVTSFCEVIYITSLPGNNNLTSICFLSSDKEFTLVIPRYLTMCVNNDFPERFWDLSKDTWMVFNKGCVIDLTVEQLQERDSTHHLSTTSPFLIPLRCSSPFQTLVLDNLIEDNVLRLRTLHVRMIRIP